LLPNFLTYREASIVQSGSKHKFCFLANILEDRNERKILSLMELRVDQDPKDKHKLKWLKYS
jgi:hypothetical protein